MEYMRQSQKNNNEIKQVNFQVYDIFELAFDMSPRQDVQVSKKNKDEKKHGDNTRIHQMFMRNLQVTKVRAHDNCNLKELWAAHMW